MIPFSKPVYYGNEKKYLNDAFDSTWISEGAYNKELESRFRNIFDAKTCLLTNNGTSALQLAYLVGHVKPMDEVILPGFCFQAAANVAFQLGAYPVFVDVDIDTWMPTKTAIVNEITEDTLAIVIVHNYGYAQKSFAPLPVFTIEDCSEAIFTQVNKNYVGTFGDVATFSFHATKTITTGEGGMLMTNNPFANDRALLYRSHGLEVRGTYDHKIPGNNFRMTNLQAAIGLAQLEKMDKIIYRKQLLTKRYIQNLKGEDGVYLHPSDGDEVLWSFPVRLDLSRFPESKKVQTKMLESQIEVRPGFTAASNIRYFGAKNLPTSEYLEKSVVVLPLYTSLTEEDVDKVCDKLLKIRSYYGR